jgi:hypothetical protein
MKRSLLSTLLLFPALAALAGPAEPFNGKDLTNWEVRGKADSKWTVGEPSMSKTNPATLDVKAGGNALVNVVAGHGQSHDLVSKETYGDIKSTASASRKCAIWTWVPSIPPRLPK